MKGQQEGLEQGAVFPSEWFGVRLASAAGRQQGSGICETEHLSELRLELGDTGSESILVGNRGVPLQGQFFVFGSHGGEPIGEVLTGVQGTGEVNYSFVVDV
ncbi:hypothetical protein FPQ18DRAFT_311426 [Pyronema domesticum]|nr:hypothetical protein FPQ18DRAFT_311426 [Pyronema domesticum]